MKYLRTEYRIEPYACGGVLKYWAYQTIIRKGFFGTEVESYADRVGVGVSGFYDTRENARAAIESEKSFRKSIEEARQKAWEMQMSQLPEVIPYD